MDSTYEKGTRLMVELCDGKIYEGIFCCGNKSKISLTNVSAYPDNTEFPGLQHFYPMEILSVTVLDDSEKDSSTCGSENDNEPQMNSSEYDKLKESAYNYTYLPMVDATFHSMINYIKLCTEISVIAFGNLYGRSSKISLLAIGTKREIILFDILISKMRAFDMGLRAVLEAEDITKVVHNSKILSDCLHHSYNVSLKNVFDTQVADYMLTQKNEGSFPEKMTSLADCVHTYLKIPANVIKRVEMSQKHLLERPLSDKLKLSASLQVSYLSTLKNIVNKKMLHSFNVTTECYSNCMKNEDPAASLSLVKNNVPEKVKKLELTL